MNEHISLTESEWRIMQLLWEKGACTLRELTDALRDETGWTPNALISFLRRMEAKGAVRVSGTRRALRYEALLERDETIRTETESMLVRVYRGSAHLMVQNAVSTSPLTDSEIDELIAILQKGRKNG